MLKINTTRRELLKSGALLGAGIAMPTVFTPSSVAAYTNKPTGSTVTLGFNLPLSGPYAEEGTDEFRGFQLAVKHLNGEGDGGMINTFSSKELKGNGILGKKVLFVTGDSKTNAGVARDSARSMIVKDRAVMISGGASSSVAIAMQGLCQQEGVIFMASLTHSNDTTGKDKKANGFRHFFNAYISTAALAPVLASEYGTDRNVYHLSVDYTWGWTHQESFAAATEAKGWKTIANVNTPFPTTDFSPFLKPILDSDADVLVLNHFGGNLVNSLADVAKLGLRDRVVNGKNFEVVIPTHSDINARRAGDNIKGIIGAANWHSSLQDEASIAFVKSFIQEYNALPGDAAHTVYCQTLLYADAVERAGSFSPCGVVQALEGFDFDGLGNGPTHYRAADHQCIKDVLIAKGKENPGYEADLLEVSHIISREQVEYPADHPMFAGGLLGTCNNG